MLGPTCTCKVDPITENQTRGRFARLCIKIDIFKPLVGMLNVENINVRVEYEILGLVCFQCGRFGHGKEMCKEGVIDKNDKIEEVVDTVDQHDEKEMSDKSMYRLEVSYYRNNRKLGCSKYEGKGYGGVSSLKGNNKNGVKTRFISGKSSKGGKTSSGGNIGSKISGSRFEILLDEDIDDEVSLVNNQKKGLHHILPSKSKFLVILLM
ncbi:hypothetical protein ACOSP7_018854 [Xanthoceras sorbifolium]